jgi:hypothetical protein
MLIADSAGIIQGKFTVPPNIPAGTKLVRVQGDQGTVGSANYTGKAGILSIEERRKITTQTIFYYDPLAQTFVPTEGFHFAGVDVKFHARGALTNNVQLQLRTVDNGYPARVLLGEGQLPATLMNLSGGWTRILLAQPVYVEQNTEYAFVLMTDDAVHAVQIAQLGKFDPINGWVASQPYNVGLLFSSSNNSAWTAHQDMDMTFRILGAQFTQASRTITLGSLTAVNLTDLLVLAGVQRPTPDTQVELVFTRADGSTFKMMEGQTISFAESITETLQVTAILKGSVNSSPIVLPNVQAVLGALQGTGTYITRAFEVGANARVDVTFECLLSGSSGVQVHVQTGADPLLENSWTLATSGPQSPVGDGWVQRNYYLDPVTVALARVRITLTGSALYRPRVRGLRAVAQDHIGS